LSTACQIVVCGSIVPDPLRPLEPVATPTGPALKNEMMLPAVLDPWAGHMRFSALPSLECGDVSPLSDWQTCLPVPKRGHARALHTKPT